MEDHSSKVTAESNKITEKQIIRTESSSSDDYELVESNITENVEKIASTPVLENLVVSEDLINDAMINSPSSNNVLVGKSIFYDCLDEKSKSEKLSDTDDGNVMWH